MIRSIPSKSVQLLDLLKYGLPGGISKTVGENKVVEMTGVFKGWGIGDPKILRHIFKEDLSSRQDIPIFIGSFLSDWWDETVPSAMQFAGDDTHADAIEANYIKALGTPFLKAHAVEVLNTCRQVLRNYRGKTVDPAKVAEDTMIHLAQVLYGKLFTTQELAQIKALIDENFNKFLIPMLVMGKYGRERGHKILSILMPGYKGYCKRRAAIVQMIGNRMQKAAESKNEVIYGIVEYAREHADTPAKQRHLFASHVLGLFQALLDTTVTPMAGALIYLGKLDKSENGVLISQLYKEILADVTSLSNNTNLFLMFEGESLKTVKAFVVFLLHMFPTVIMAPQKARSDFTITEDGLNIEIRKGETLYLMLYNAMKKGVGAINDILSSVKRFIGSDLYEVAKSPTFGGRGRNRCKGSVAAILFLMSFISAVALERMTPTTLDEGKETTGSILKIEKASVALN